MTGKIWCLLESIIESIIASS